MFSTFSAQLFRALHTALANDDKVIHQLYPEVRIVIPRPVNNVHLIISFTDIVSRFSPRVATCGSE